MFSIDAQLERLTQIVGPLQSEVSLPESWRQLRRDDQPRPSIPGDWRQYPRWTLPAVAAMRYVKPLLALKRSDSWFAVYSVDVSRNGVCFLHLEQAYPTEQLQLLFADERKLFVEVMRCRRLQEKCYEVGARFVSASVPGTAGVSSEVLAPQPSVAC
jgi:hypothetical protein